MNRQSAIAWTGANWTNRAILLVVIAVAMAFAIWVVVHLGHPVLGGHEAGGATWAERPMALL
jgi:hypothetical protein